VSSIGRTLSYLDKISLVLDPSFDANETVSKYGKEYMSRTMVGSMSLAELLKGSIDMIRFVEALPAKANQIVNNLANQRLKFKIELTDQTDIIRGMQKIANRVTCGILLASLVIGASLLARVETSFTLLGYPGLAIILFLVATSGSFFLLFRMIRGDK